MFQTFGKEIDWDGHFDRSFGKEPVYHVTADDRIRICKNEEWNRYLFIAQMDTAARSLARAINDCKEKYSYNNARGGGFCINEFGIVIVPVSTGGNGYVLPKAIGVWRGELLFQFDSRLFSLNRKLGVGDSWPYPYLGMKYHLAAKNFIYYKLQAADGESFPRPPTADPQLIRNLRSIRNKGPMSFLVNNHGIVLAKAEEDWEPQYAGVIDFGKWYPDPLRCTREMSKDDVTDMIRILSKQDRRLWPDAKIYDALLQNYWLNGRTLNAGEQVQLAEIFIRHN